LIVCNAINPDVWVQFVSAGTNFQSAWRWAIPVPYMWLTQLGERIQTEPFKQFHLGNSKICNNNLSVVLPSVTSMYIKCDLSWHHMTDEKMNQINVPFMVYGIYPCAK
jgi:hypothetical protein